MPTFPGLERRCVEEAGDAVRTALAGAPGGYHGGEVAVEVPASVPPAPWERALRPEAAGEACRAPGLTLPWPLAPSSCDRV